MFTSLTLLVAAGLLGPLLAAGRRPLFPVLLGELVAGAVLGRSGFGVLDPAGQPFPVFLTLGFAMLMLGAGYEVDVSSTQLRRGMSRGVVAVLLTLVAAAPVGLFVSRLFNFGRPQLLGVLLAGSSAAVVYPIIEERKFSAPTVPILLAWIALADGITAILMPLSLTGLGATPVALAGDALIVLVAAVIIVVGGRLVGRPGLAEAIRESRQRRWALQLRLSVLLLFAMAAIADRSGGSLLVAGFAAGIVLRRFRPPERLALQLSGLADGFFVPAFFVLVGATLNLRELLRDPTAISLAIAMAIGAVTVHLVASFLAMSSRRLATGLLASAQLGLPAAAAALGLTSHLLSPALGTALVAGGCLSLVPATLGSILLKGGSTPDKSVS